MNRLRITPFLILNPLVIIMAVRGIIINSDGFAAIMLPMFFVIIVVSIVLLIVDRIVAGRINMWILYTSEILILLVSIKLLHQYIYG